MKRLVFTFVLLTLFCLCEPQKTSSGTPYQLTRESVSRWLKMAQKAEIESSDFTEDLLKTYIDLLGIKNGEIVFLQATLETGNFTSDIFLINNNLFGMRLARIRKTTAVGTRKGHAVYNHWTDSVKDYKLWQEYHDSLINASDNYLMFLASLPYAEDRGYTKKLKNLLN